MINSNNNLKILKRNVIEYFWLEKRIIFFFLDKF